MNPGDTIHLTTKTDQYEGVYMPSSTDQTIILKLPSGYNIGIDRAKVTTSKTLQSGSAPALPPEKAVPKQSRLKNVLILHTGGTLASKVSYQTGGVVSRFAPEDILTLFPTIKTIANIDTKLIRNMFSEDMRFSHWNLIAQEITQTHDRYDALIITHGTDTMHYTSAALSFMLSHINKPILLVGAQRSSDRGSSDAALNLTCALHFATQTNYAGVALCMHETINDDDCLIIPGTKARKLHSSRRDAFKTINGTPIARINAKGTLTYLTDIYPKHDSQRQKIALTPIKEDLKIGILKTHPNLYALELTPYQTFDGLILEGTGLGHFPVNVIDDATKEHKKILAELEKLAKKMPVLMTSQCIQGRVDLNVYETGRKLQQAGIPGTIHDMTTETAFAKLAYLLSTHQKKDIPALLLQNMHGEISDRIPYEKDLL